MREMTLLYCTTEGQKTGFYPLFPTVWFVHLCWGVKYCYRQLCFWTFIHSELTEKGWNYIYLQGNLCFWLGSQNVLHEHDIVCEIFRGIRTRKAKINFVYATLRKRKKMECGTLRPRNCDLKFVPTVCRGQYAD